MFRPKSTAELKATADTTAYIVTAFVTAARDLRATGKDLMSLGNDVAGLARAALVSAAHSAPTQTAAAHAQNVAILTRAAGNAASAYMQTKTNPADAKANAANAFGAAINSQATAQPQRDQDEQDDIDATNDAAGMEEGLINKPLELGGVQASFKPKF